MGQRSVVKNIVSVALSNIITLLAGVGVGLLLPKLLEVEDYGWYKTFTLYVTYLGFAHLGLLDGIVLEYGGLDFDQLDRPLFRNYFSWYSIINGFFAGTLLIISVFLQDNNRIIIICLALYLLVGNFAGYFQQISQITQRFREFSRRNILSGVLKIADVGLLYICTLTGVAASYKLYLTFFLATEFILTTWYLFTYKDIVVGEKIPLSNTKENVFLLCKQGFPLLFANLCGLLILSLDRQFVRVLFDTTVYAKYAFAYNLLSLVTAATSAISTVLYPTLKRTSETKMREYCASLVGLILVFIFGAIILYFPLCIFIEWFLPKYTESLLIFRIIFPGLAMSSSITVIMHNYYKTEGKSGLYFKKSIVVLLVSAATNMMAYALFHTAESISIASILTMIFWYLYVENYFRKTYQYDGKRNYIYIMLMLIGFYVISSISNHYISAVIYLFYFVIITMCFQKKTMTSMLKLLHRDT